jgi:sRNA-binding protein
MATTSPSTILVGTEALTLATAENPTSRRQRVYNESLALLNLLCESWPDVFRHENELPVPLSVGIREEVIRELDSVIEPYVVAVALKIYCQQWAYIHCLTTPGAWRVALDGTPTAPVSQEHQDEAAKRLTAALEARRRRKEQSSNKIAKPGRHTKENRNV